MRTFMCELYFYSEKWPNQKALTPIFTYGLNFMFMKLSIDAFKELFTIANCIYVIPHKSFLWYYKFIPNKFSRKMA